VPFSSTAVLQSLGYNTFTPIVQRTSTIPLAKTYVLNDPSMAHPWGSWLVRNNIIYYSTSKGVIPVPSMQVFTSNGGTPDQVLAMNAADQSVLVSNTLAPMTLHDTRVPAVSVTITNSTPIAKISANMIINDNGTYYWISDDLIKVPFSSTAVLQSLGYNTFTPIIQSTTSIPLAQSYILNNPSMAHPWGSWLSLKGTVYYVTSSGMIPVPSEAVFTSNSGVFDQVLPMNNADQLILKSKTLAVMALYDSRVGK
jgi:hypothetical protein